MVGGRNWLARNLNVFKKKKKIVSPKNLDVSIALEIQCKCKPSKIELIFLNVLVPLAASVS